MSLLLKFKIMVSSSSCSRGSLNTDEDDQPVVPLACPSTFKKVDLVSQHGS